MRTMAAVLALVCACSGRAAEAEKPVAHEIRSIEGWTVRVDARLLAPEHAAEGARTLDLLRDRLGRIAEIVESNRLAKLRAVPIQLDLTHGKLTSMQYHPSAGWLTANGYSTNLAKCVHIPVAAGFTDPRHQHAQPWSVLHELAHAFHDQVLDFDEPRVLAAYRKYKASGHGDATLFVAGRRVKHYALTDQKEFFAEMSEAYFGTNDFFPFVHGELKESEPEIHALLRDIWGPFAWERPRGR